MAPDSDFSQRLAFEQLELRDFQLLADLEPLLQERADDLVDAFYRHLLSFPETRKLLRSPEVRERLRIQQREYVLNLALPCLDDEAIGRLRQIGEVHERIGVEPRWYLGAYSVYFSLLTPLICERLQHDREAAEKTVIACQRRLMLDAQIAIEAYIERHEQALEAANAELADASRQLQTRYEEQHRQLSRTAQRARAAEELASMGTLVAGLAHEIGTPMGVIQGHAKLLESAVEDDRARWRLQTIQEQIGRISRIIQSLLNMARPGTSKRGPVDLEGLIENTLAFLTEKFRRREVEIERDFEPVPSVTGDAERLQQLCLNLFLNATDAMPEGGTLVVALRRQDDEHVLLRIADTGLGIADEHLAKLFDPFFTTKDAGTGSGLGLTVVHGIVADHGGRIEVESTPGEGTTFSIRLPAAPVGS